MSNLGKFLSELPSSTIERVLMVEYLLSRGYLWCELPLLAPQAAAYLLKEAREFARRAAGGQAPSKP